MLRIRSLVMFVIIVLSTSGLALAQDGPPPGPPAGRPPLVECVEGQDIPCVMIVTDVSEIVGTWRRYFEGGTLTGFTAYEENGMFDIRQVLGGDIDVRGVISFEDNLAHIAALPESPAPPECKAPGTYEIRMFRIGEQPVALTYYQIGEDSCPMRSGDLAEPWLYYTGADVAEMDPDMVITSQSLVSCPDEMDSDMESYPCDVIATSADDVAGLWKQYLGNPNLAAPMGMGYIRYLADGTYFIADTAVNSIEVYENYPYGAISFDEIAATITVDSQVPPGCETGDYVLRVIKYGSQPVALTYTIVVDECLPRRGDLGEALIWIVSE